MSNWVGRATPGFHRCIPMWWRTFSFLIALSMTGLCLSSQRLAAYHCHKEVHPGRAGTEAASIKERCCGTHKNSSEGTLCPTASRCFQLGLKGPQAPAHPLSNEHYSYVCNYWECHFTSQGWGYVIYSAGREVHLCNLATTVLKPAQPAFSLHITMSSHVSSFKFWGGQQAIVLKSSVPQCLDAQIR
jgi:hypothetical protein